MCVKGGKRANNIKQNLKTHKKSVKKVGNSVEKWKRQTADREKCFVKLFCRKTAPSSDRVI